MYEHKWRDEEESDPLDLSQWETEYETGKPAALPEPAQHVYVRPPEPVHRPIPPPTTLKPLPERLPEPRSNKRLLVNPTTNTAQLTAGTTNSTNTILFAGLWAVFGYCVAIAGK